MLAPSAGRVLKVPVTEGSVVLAGESIATIAANEYLLRLELPERHARFIKVGRSGSPRRARLRPGREAARRGAHRQVYPELQNGRVVADAEVAGLGSYFVGERVLVWISAGKRTAFVVPRDLCLQALRPRLCAPRGQGRHSADVVVQTGRDVNERRRQ